MRVSEAYDKYFARLNDKLKEASLPYPTVTLTPTTVRSSLLVNLQQGDDPLMMKDFFSHDVRASWTPKQVENAKELQEKLVLAGMHEDLVEFFSSMLFMSLVGTRDGKVYDFPALPTRESIDERVRLSADYASMAFGKGDWRFLAQVTFPDASSGGLYFNNASGQLCEIASERLEAGTLEPGASEAIEGTLAELIASLDPMIM